MIESARSFLASMKLGMPHVTGCDDDLFFSGLEILQINVGFHHFLVLVFSSIFLASWLVFWRVEPTMLVARLASNTQELRANPVILIGIPNPIAFSGYYAVM